MSVVCYACDRDVTRPVLRVTVGYLAPQDSKNAVEEYVYDLRSRLADDLADFEREEAKSSINSELDTTENWLYEEGEECLKHVYIDRLAELKVSFATSRG